MPQLMLAGTHSARVIEIRQGATHTQLGFEAADGRTACQRVPNDVLANGLRSLGLDSAKQLQGCACVIRVEQVSAEPGVNLARAVACQWLHSQEPNHIKRIVA